jgi:hypothetical protein
MKRIDIQTPRIHLITVIIIIIIIIIVITILQSPCSSTSLQRRQRPPSTAQESSRVAPRCIAPVMRADTTRHETIQDTPAALCNAVMQCNAMPSNPPRTARVSARGPDARRWRE